MTDDNENVNHIIISHHKFHSYNLSKLIFFHSFCMLALFRMTKTLEVSGEVDMQLIKSVTEIRNAFVKDSVQAKRMRESLP